MLLPRLATRGCESCKNSPNWARIMLKCRTLSQQKQIRITYIVRQYSWASNPKDVLFEEFNLPIVHLATLFESSLYGVYGEV